MEVANARVKNIEVMGTYVKRDTATRSGISTGREGPVVPVPEPVLPFRD